ncbi:MAG: DUF2723 domain-containing protein [Vicinamibacteraceae bacterium]|nr:DUF2723 domain-containing protein [Vicinamibacteraceae bacterium]
MSQNVLRERAPLVVAADPVETGEVRTRPWMAHREWALLAVAALLLLALRLPFLPPTLDDIDGYNFDLGVHDFDPVKHHPHPPGYPVFIFLAKIAHPLIGTHAAALALLSGFFGALVVFPLYGLMRELTTRAGAVLATTLCVASPLVWFNSVRPMSDTTGLFFILLAQWLLVAGVMRADRAPVVARRYWHWGVVAAALAVGVRLQVVWLVGPVLLVGFLRHAGFRAGTVVLFGVTAAGWAVPLVTESGGPFTYYESLRHVINTALPVEPLLTAPSLRRAVLSAWDVLGTPWGPLWMAVPVLALVVAGFVRMALWDRRALGWALLLFAPYALYHYLLQWTETIRYALPVVPLLALLASAALVTRAGSAHWRRLVPVAAAAAFITLSAGSTVPALLAYHRTPNPVSQAMAAVDTLDASPGAFVVSGHPLFARHLALLASRHTVLQADFRRAWMPMVKYWKQGGRRPILFLRNPRRSTLLLVGRDGQTPLGTWQWPARVLPLMKGERPNSVELVRLDPPHWFAESGFFLTDEVGPPDEIARQEHRIYVRPSDRPRVLYATGSIRNAPAAEVVMLKGDAVRRTWHFEGDFAIRHQMQPIEDEDYVPVTFRTTAPVLFGDVWVHEADRAVVRPRSGFNGTEFDRRDRRFRWIGPEASAEVYLPGDHARLRIRGSVPVKYYRLPVMLTLRWEGRPLRAFAITSEDFSFECDVPAPVSADDWGTLTLSSSHHFVPDEVQGNGDTRQLAVRLYEFAFVSGR